jgi:hypothetical protein
MNLAPIFKSLKSLRKLFLNETKLTIKGISNFLSYQYNNVSLHELHLENNDMKSEFTIKSEVLKRQLAEI